MDLKREEVEGYRNKLIAGGGRVGGMVGVVEEELRERLRIQERDMAEQLDRMEVQRGEEEEGRYIEGRRKRGREGDYEE